MDAKNHHAILGFPSCSLRLPLIPAMTLVIPRTGRGWAHSPVLAAPGFPVHWPRRGPCGWLNGLCVAHSRGHHESGGLEGLEKTGFPPSREWRKVGVAPVETGTRAAHPTRPFRNEL